MKLKYISFLLLGAVSLTSCNDFLDEEPQDQVTPEKYFNSVADLADYSINLYSFPSINPGSYGISVFAWDNGTDNQVGMGASARWNNDLLKVGYTNPWRWGNIRSCNYFLERVLPKFEAGQIQGKEADIHHYIGEVYFLRALYHFNKLQSIGDCPIVDKTYKDESSELIAESKREPRNKVARFILSDLDKALENLKEVPPTGQKTRISRNVALLLRSRVALYEGTFEKYFAGTAFVPNGKGWAGDKDAAAGYDNAAEVKYFLKEAMKSAKELGDKMVNNLTENQDTPEGMSASLKPLNPYYMMFCDVNMEPYKEVLMWRQYSVAQGVNHNINMQLERNGCGTGWTRGLVNSFLMDNGLPIYSATSGYDAETQEKNGVSAVLENRDSRIRIFTKGDKSVDFYQKDSGEPAYYNMRWLIDGTAETRAVTGYALKKGKYYSYAMGNEHHKGQTGFAIYRGAEALLNYMEASYELNHSVDGTAAEYWKALRRRAKVSEDYAKTIAATDMNEEAKGDFGAYSAGKLIDKTLYNIRRERRNEFIGEGMRWDDLVRWRACDQVHNYQIEGIRYWGSKYEGAWTNKNPETGAQEDACVVDTKGEQGNMSPKENSVYVRPFQIKAVHNDFYDGYNFMMAHYLAPLPQHVFMQTQTNPGDIQSSVVYQNPGWERTDNTAAHLIDGK